MSDASHMPASADLRALVRENFDPVFRYCALRTGDARGAEILATEVFSRARNLAERLAGGDRPVLAALLDLAHRIHSQPRTSGAAATFGPATAIDEADCQRARRLLGSVDHRTAAALVLALVCNQSLPDIARSLHVSEDEVRRCVYRAVVKVQRRLEGDDAR